MAELLYWIVLDYRGVPNKVIGDCSLTAFAEASVRRPSLTITKCVGLMSKLLPLHHSGNFTLQRIN